MFDLFVDSTITDFSAQWEDLPRSGEDEGLLVKGANEGIKDPPGFAGDAGPTPPTPLYPFAPKPFVPVGPGDPDILFGDAEPTGPSLFDVFGAAPQLPLPAGEFPILPPPSSDPAAPPPPPVQPHAPLIPPPSGETGGNPLDNDLLFGDSEYCFDYATAKSWRSAFGGM